MSLVETTACLLPTRTRKPTSSPSDALRFLDGAVAHLDRERDAAHGDGVGRVGAGAPGGGDQAFGEIGEGGLIEERRHFDWHRLMGGVGEDRTSAKMCLQGA